MLWAADHYLPDTMNHVLSCVKKEKERTAAFQALGLLSVAVRAEFQVYLPKVLEIIKAALPLKDFAHKWVCVEVGGDYDVLEVCELIPL